MRINTKRMALSSVLLAIGLVLPLLTMQIKEIGDTLLPMHLPVLLCGFLCGAYYGGAVGLILPFLRSIIFGLPPIFPNAVWLAAELMTYGLLAGFVFSRTRKNMGGIYVSLIAAMLGGRIVWGATKAALLGVGEGGFTVAAFLAGGFVDAIPGIALQLVLIPLLVRAVRSKSVDESQ